MAEVTASPAAIERTGAAEPERSAPGTAARSAGWWLGELGWLLLFVLLFPLTVLMVGSLIALIVNAAVALIERF